jgi:nitrite reductase/ring-hydroxylating ferredoxin subunit
MRRVFHRAASTGEIPKGTGKLVAIPGEGEIVVYHSQEEGFHASVALCPHQNERLDLARLEGCEVICRRHHLRFDLNTGDCTNAGGYWLKTYEVRVEGEDIMIGLWED